MLTIGSLFSGIGGLELGLEWAGLGPTVWQCEIDPWCRAVLAAHWPKATRFHDVRELNEHAPPQVDLVCGGFPCQDVSDSEGAGLAGARSGLWFDMLSVVRALRPVGVVVENVSALSTRGVDVVLGGLASCGYDAVWFPVRASAVGLPHRRERLLIVAHAHGDRRLAQPPARIHVRGTRGDDADRRGVDVPGPADGAEAWRAFRGSGGPEPGIRRGADGFPTELDRRRLAALGNAVVPEVAQIAGEVIVQMLRTDKVAA